MPRILIEGWRGVSHSFAMVNQCQILEILKHEDVELFHRDMPFALPHWDAVTLSAGFSAENQAKIASLRDAGDTELDWVYRICSPYFEVPGHGCPVMTFMVTELGLRPKSFHPDALKSDFFTRDANQIVTPTNWSKDRLVEHGFDPDKVHVIPHGVCTNTYFPLSASERDLARKRLGIQDDECVCLNLGPGTWNKGSDLVLLAFATLRQAGHRLRLILKDQRQVYGISIDRILNELVARYPSLFDARVLNAISVVGTNLSQAELRQLYGLADMYVSPYRAEGFNLPVLEAIACGTPVVVTQGGATDDFCTSDVALMVSSTPGQCDLGDGTVGRYQEPDLQQLIEAMDACARGQALDRSRMVRGREEIMARMSWSAATDSLLSMAEAIYA